MHRSKTVTHSGVTHGSPTGSLNLLETSILVETDSSLRSRISVATSVTSCSLLKVIENTDFTRVPKRELGKKKVRHTGDHGCGLLKEAAH